MRKDRKKEIKIDENNEETYRATNKGGREVIKRRKNQM
jgi:hypothetical protein